VNTWSVILAGVLAFFVMLAEHYFPWHRLLGRPLRAPVTYILGLGALLAIFAGWCLKYPLSPSWEALVVMVVIVGSGGGAVIAAYLFDGHHDTRADLSAVHAQIEYLEDELARLRGGGDAQT